MVGYAQTVVTFHQPRECSPTRLNPIRFRTVREKRFIRLVGYLGYNPVIHQTVQIFCQHKDTPGSNNFPAPLFRRHDPRYITHFFMPVFRRRKAGNYPCFHMSLILHISEPDTVRSRPQQDSSMIIKQICFRYRRINPIRQTKGRRRSQQFTFYMIGLPFLIFL